MKPSKLAFEVPYLDNSGVRVAVRYDSNKEFGIQIEHGGDICSFPADDLDFIRDALYEIMRALPEKPKEPA